MPSTPTRLVWWFAVAAATLGLAAFAAGACGDNKQPSTPDIIVRLVTPAGPTATPTLLPGQTVEPLVPPELVIPALSLYQAGALLVSVTGDVAGGQATFLGKRYPLSQGSQSQYTFIPIDTGDPPGAQGLTVDVVLKNGTRGTLRETVTILPAEWTVDYLEFTGEQAALLDPAIAAAELGLLQGIYRRVTPDKLWDGLWQMPVQGGLTSRFGEQRSINGGPPAGHHGGTDISALEGTPVYATNNGRVVMARELQVRGNMVVIDHGGGLYSGYAHLSEISVAEGQDVVAGELIAAVGNTGLSTGAHLHWEMAIHGVLVDALRFTDGTNGF
jgi:murein DD-endopeptidase MepM/ murein hydrolase activator NlpD